MSIALKKLLTNVVIRQSSLVVFRTKFSKPFVVRPIVGAQVVPHYRCHALASFCTKTQDQKGQDQKTQDEDSTEKDAEERNRRAQQNWKMTKLSFLLFGFAMSMSAGVLVYEINKPLYDEKGERIEDEFSHLPLPVQWVKRIFKEMNMFTKMIQEPSRDKLLPEPLKHPYVQPAYTLVLEFTDILVHPEWTYKTGWRFKKRPGVDQFLEAVSPLHFETVIYTAEAGMTIHPILETLDPQGCIMYRLYRDATRFIDNHHVKDLDALNRDLSKIIVVDWNPDNVKLHQENALIIPRWAGNDDDTTLYDLVAFLKVIEQSNVDDVRDVLNYYRQFENPLAAFRENQRKLLSQMEEQDSKLLKSGSGIIKSKWTPSFIKSFN